MVALLVPLLANLEVGLDQQRCPSPALFVPGFCCLWPPVDPHPPGRFATPGLARLVSCPLPTPSPAALTRAPDLLSFLFAAPDARCKNFAATVAAVSNESAAHVPFQFRMILTLPLRGSRIQIPAASTPLLPWGPAGESRFRLESAAAVRGRCDRGSRSGAHRPSPAAPAAVSHQRVHVGRC